MSKSIAVRTEVPFSQLRMSARNTRKNRGTEAHKAKVAELAESIAQMGLLQNLVVHADGEFFDVDAGGTRFEAIGLLIEGGRWPVEQLVPVMVIGIDEALAASYTENSKRYAMHPADEFEAFVALTSEGWTIDQIADKFGVTPLVVERRIKLQAAAPELLQAFRNNVLTTDQLIALCSTDNHERQVEVWNRTKNNDWQRTPNNLRAAVIDKEIDGSKDPRLALIGGVEAYEKAGGAVRRDMFSGDGNGVILEDASLLATLMFHKLEEVAEDHRNEGWKWVEVWPTWDYTAYSRFGAAPTVVRVLPEEQAEQLKALNAELDAVETELYALDSDENPERYSELDSRQSVLQELIDQLEEQTVGYQPEVMKHAGVIVAFSREQIRIERGLVKTEDRAQVEALLEQGARISGGRESQPAGRKVDAVSEALRKSLLGHKNLAAQRVTARSPHAAKALLVSQMVTSMRNKPSDAPTDYSISSGWGSRSYCTITDEAGVEQQKAFETVCKNLIEDLPTDAGALWEALYALSASELDALLAHAVARSVSLATEPGRGMTDKFVTTLGLDMAEHFTATAGNYLGRVPKELVLEALVEAGKVKDDADRMALVAMKKGVLAKEAEARLQGSGWVPKLIRTASSEKPAAGKKGKSSSKATA
ncbi:ParB/RepB/Spo0J family partition protein [Pseudomonas mosselii]|uniref:ParB N-terminal domain-containing protein n=1 Tax=Pseudomonas mosselii TaxID=78327 RepID=A0A7W2Q133_9PSED|nr:ParB/RepB/Spo0J family partition protein [Pseudomonas mosselii]MBA6068103.1 ParB N-terminal domain-containing protein [Pseudomonas mosselii]